MIIIARRKDQIGTEVNSTGELPYKAFAPQCPKLAARLEFSSTLLPLYVLEKSSFTTLKDKFAQFF
ncbi:hypothetical protein C9I89_09355 [Photobacterium lipolyticum]|uniref:Uncharacterized protein n=1 Tax=Photobacterium lipolyticum TaxID=266810 RepID=A0A2T3MZV0_9GAMM|nr:hypothetical protein C9I89_09355 [Photobacterium lipolyticum]